VLVAHTYNPSYSGGRDQEDLCLKPLWANSFGDPISKIPNNKKELQSGSSGRAPVLYAWNPEFRDGTPVPPK
jgi:hypothetical protein